MLIIEFSVQNGYAKLLKVTFYICAIIDYRYITYKCNVIVEYKLFINANYIDLEKFDMANYLKYLSIIVIL